ncbi:MAG TPA: hypothetical protein VK498_10525 [Ferruginibacter sp.]|nr:hypothetical protein [Ferruginibacter sp.]
MKKNLPLLLGVKNNQALKKIKFTPLFICAACSILFAIIYIIWGRGGNLAGLGVIVILGTGICCLFIYFILRIIFKDKIRGQVITELLIILIAGFYYYSNNGEVILHLPPDFKGHLLFVFGVEKKQPLSRNSFFDPDIDIDVPASGIIITSSRPKYPIVIIYKKKDLTRKLKAGYDIPLKNGSLNCNNKNYLYIIFGFGSMEPVLQAESLQHKKEWICSGIHNQAKAD